VDYLAARANAAIGEFVSLFGLDQSRAEAIRAKYGSATFSLVSEVYAFTAGYPVDWSAETYEEAIANVGSRLKQAYPFLTQDSVRRLESCFAYSWK
jgi:hypothetical protein